LLLLELSTQTFGILLTILVAWRFPSVWALVIGTLVAAAAKSVLSHFPHILPGPPNSFAWDTDCARSLVNFGKWVFLGTAFYFFGVQADRLILGKLVSFTILGVYNIAFTVSDIPRQVIQQFSFRIALPFIARMQHLPRDEFRKRVLRYRFFALAAGALILATVVVCGGPLVVALYDARYQSAQWIVPILALGLWHTLLYNTTGNILFAIGKPAYNAIGTGLFCASMYLALPVAFHYFGLRGAVISIAAGDLPLYFTLAIGAAREKVGLWVQDALATLLFLALLLSGYAIRYAFVGHFPLGAFNTLLHR
jgi:O-antigen/teichoic acid export membrane protein